MLSPALPILPLIADSLRPATVTVPPRTAAPAACAPIALFLYNRPRHTLQCLRSLAANPEFLRSPLYIFCDGAPAGRADPAVEEVRAFARHLVHPDKTVIEAPANLGLANAIIGGVNCVLQAHGQVIVIEDDLIVSPVFLDFMNRSLTHYQDNERVMQVCGHMYPIPVETGNDATLLPVVSSWGWGTWRRAWASFDPSMHAYDQIARDPALQHRFNLQGSTRFFTFLKRQHQGQLDSWWIRWYLSVFTKDGLAVYPCHSLVHNKGFDGTGVHCGAGGCPFDSAGMPHGEALTRLPPASHTEADPVTMAHLRTLMRTQNRWWRRASRRLQTWIN